MVRVDETGQRRICSPLERKKRIISCNKGNCRPDQQREVNLPRLRCAKRRELQGEYRRKAGTISRLGDLIHEACPTSIDSPDNRRVLFLSWPDSRLLLLSTPIYPVGRRYVTFLPVKPRSQIFPYLYLLRMFFAPLMSRCSIYPQQHLYILPDTFFLRPQTGHVCVV